MSLVKTLNFARFVVIFLLTASLLFCCVKPSMSIDSLRVLIPLYSYPSWYNSESYTWGKLAESAKKIPITAVINPSDGPGTEAPNRDYVKGLQQLREGKVTLLGYVATNYGKRSLTKVKSDIDLYSRYYQLNGIFLDEAASNAGQIDYYQKIYQYIKKKSRSNLVVLNQGTQADPEYLSRPVMDITVIFENFSSEWQNYQALSYVKTKDSAHFSSLIHSVPDASTMQHYIDLAKSRNVGYIYVTDDSPNSPDRNPWNSLPSFWQDEVNYIYRLNQVTKRH